jgi:hypothetical protein
MIDPCSMVVLARLSRWDAIRLATRPRVLGVGMVDPEDIGVLVGLVASCGGVGAAIRHFAQRARTAMWDGGLSIEERAEYEACAQRLEDLAAASECSATETTAHTSRPTLWE